MICTDCGFEYSFGSFPFCFYKGKPTKHEKPGGSIDLLPKGGFDFEHNKKSYRVRTLSDIRAIERESEKDAAEGKGAQIAWREFSQNSSNRDRNSLGENPAQLTHKELKENLRKYPVRALSEEEAYKRHGK